MKANALFLIGVLVEASCAALFNPMRGKSLRQRVRQMLVDKGVVAPLKVVRLTKRHAFEPIPHHHF